MSDEKTAMRQWERDVRRRNRGKKWPRDNMLFHSRVCTPESVTYGLLLGAINQEVSWPLWYIEHHMKGEKGFERQLVLARKYADEWASWKRGPGKVTWKELRRLAAFHAKVVNEFENLC